jgi:hypothetical protein
MSRTFTISGTVKYTWLNPGSETSPFTCITNCTYQIPPTSVTLAE